MAASGFEAHHLRVFHSHLSVQSGAYQNATFAVATAKAGTEDGCELFGHSIIVNPQGEIVAMATSWTTSWSPPTSTCASANSAAPPSSPSTSTTTPEAYDRITSQVGAVEPPGVDEALTRRQPLAPSVVKYRTPCGMASSLKS